MPDNTMSLEELIEWIKLHKYAYYQAPLDNRPYSVKILRYSIDNKKPERSTARLWTSVNGAFTVNLSEHLDRFRMDRYGW